MSETSKISAVWVAICSGCAVMVVGAIVCQLSISLQFWIYPECTHNVKWVIAAMIFASSLGEAIIFAMDKYKKCRGVDK